LAHPLSHLHQLLPGIPIVDAEWYIYQMVISLSIAMTFSEFKEA
jgi:hypothetical protein